MIAAFAGMHAYTCGVHAPERATGMHARTKYTRSVISAWPAIAACTAHLITERLSAAQSVLVHAQNKARETSSRTSLSPTTKTTEAWHGRAREQGRQGRVQERVQEGVQERVHPLQQPMQQQRQHGGESHRSQLTGYTVQGTGHGGESHRSQLTIEPDEQEPELMDDGEERLRVQGCRVLRGVGYAVQYRAQGTGYTVQGAGGA